MLMRRVKALNVLLLALLAAGVAVAVATVGAPAQPAPPARTVSVAMGVVQSVVTATGNVVASQSLAVGFHTGGPLVEVDVAVGQQVAAGQVLARVDPTDSQSALSSAQANLSAAQGKLTQLQQGLTSPEQHQNDVAVSQSQAQVSAAQTALSNAQAQAQRNAAGYGTAVVQAQGQLQRDQAALAADQAQLAADQRKLATDQAAAPPVPAAIQADQQALNADQGKVNADASSVAKDNDAVTNAVNAQQSGLLKDKQTLDQAQATLTSAQLSLQSTQAANAVKAQPPKPGDLAGAQAAVATAQAGVESAQRTLDGTTLKAPVAGTVAAVNNKVGETVSGGGSGSASSSSSASSSPGAPGAGGGVTGGGSGTATAASGGFVTLTDLGGLQVKAGFSEGDAAKVRLAQPATVSFDALGGQASAAHVVTVDVNQTVVSNVVTYNVTFALDRTVDGLKPGMTANTSVVVGQRAGVLNVPSSAVSTRGGAPAVTVLENGQRRTVEVGTGLKGDTTTEITRGLTQGQQVVLPSLITGLSSSARTGAGATTGGLGGAGATGGARTGGRPGG